MIIMCHDTRREKYSIYNYRLFKKHMAKIEKQLQQIKNCSLKKEDKDYLRAKLLEAVNSFNL